MNKSNKYLRRLEAHWKKRRELRNTKIKLPTRSGGVNDCFRPSNEASKADLREYHREEMGLRRAHQRNRKSDYKYTIHPNVRKALRNA